MEFALSHSKSWPVNTVAVVQLRVDSNGKSYSTFMEKLEEDAKIEVQNENGLILKLSKENFDILTKSNERRCKTIRTDTVSTILEQEFETDVDIQTDSEKIYETFHVLALSSAEGNNSKEIIINKSEKNGISRRESAKFDNWDLIYTETRSNKAKCPIHGDSQALNVCPCNKSNKPKGPPCMEHTDCMLPELPLDARKVTTLRRHYYPEGGWGWVIVACSLLVHVLNHGIQVSSSQLVLPASTKFKTLPVHVAGVRASVYYQAPFNSLHYQKDVQDVDPDYNVSFYEMRRFIRSRSRELNVANCADVDVFNWNFGVCQTPLRNPPY